MASVRDSRTRVAIQYGFDDRLRPPRRRQSLSNARTQPQQLPRLVGQVSSGCDRTAQRSLGKRATDPGVNRSNLSALHTSKHPVCPQLHRTLSRARLRQPTAAMEPNPMNPGKTARSSVGFSAEELDADEPIVVPRRVRPFVQLEPLDDNPSWCRWRQLAQLEREDLARGLRSRSLPCQRFTSTV